MAEILNIVEDINEDNMKNYTKEDIIKILKAQQRILKDQSNQFLDVIDVNNQIKTSLSENNPSMLIDQNNKCYEANESRMKIISFYEKSIKVQMILFFLFFLVVIWLMYDSE
jgi:hypothetical protein